MQSWAHGRCSVNDGTFNQDTNCEQIQSRGPIHLIAQDSDWHMVHPQSVFVELMSGHHQHSTFLCTPAPPNAHTATTPR